MSFEDIFFFQNKKFEHHFSFWSSLLTEHKHGFRFIQIEKNNQKSKPKFIKFKVEGNSFNKIEYLCKGNTLTNFILCNAVIFFLTRRYSGESSIIINSALYKPELLPKIYCDYVPIVLKIDDDLSLRDHLNLVKESFERSFKHQNYPVSLVKQGNDIALTSNVLILDRKASDPDIEKHDLVIYFEQVENSFELECFYNSCLFEDTFIKTLFNNFLQVIEYLDKLDTKLKNINILSNEDIKLLSQYGNGEEAEKDYVNIIQYFKHNVLLNPDSKAVVYEDEVITYKKLDQVSDALAAQLLNQYNIKRGQIIGVYLNRSIEVIVAILGIFKAGAIFLPVNTKFTAGKIESIFTDSALEFLITSTDYLFEFPYYHNRLYAIDVELNYNQSIQLPSQVLANAGDIAYIIYTSGSTGKPKGVAVEHRGLVNMIDSQINLLQLNRQDNILQFAPISFDASFYEICIALLSGGCLVVLHENIIENINKLAELIDLQNVTTIVLPPSYLKLFNKAILPTVNKIVSAGEAADIQDANFYSRFKLFINAYGPTESSICACTYKMDRFFNERTIPIGRPITNTTIYICDEFSNLQPIGVPGEIYISGPGVARGYLNMPDSTSRCFSDNAFGGPYPMYRTGDQGRWLSAGKLEFIGRKDNQVKLNGNRIELGEIEAVLKLNELIKDVAVCLINKNDQQYLIAFTVLEDNENLVVNENVGEYLSKYSKLHLPTYITISAYEIVDVFPLTANGKINKKELVRLYDASREEIAIIAPRNDFEKNIVTLWKEILNQNDIGINENFFHLGGNSLKAIKLVTEIQKRFSAKINLVDVFNHPTIQDLAVFLSAQSPTNLNSIKVIPQAESYPVSRAQQRLWLLHQLNRKATNYNISIAFKISGNFNIECFAEALKDVIKGYDILRTVFIVQNGEPRQKVNQYSAIYEMEVIDIDYNLDDIELKQYIKEKMYHPFNLENGPLIYTTIAKTIPNEYILILSLHHIIADGQSIEILMKNVKKLYIAKLRNEVFNIDLKIQYKDYVYWQISESKEHLYKEAEIFWENILLPTPEPLKLKTDFVRKSNFATQGRTVRYQIDARLTEVLRFFSLNNNVSLFNTLLTSVHILLNKETEQRDIITGIPFSGRSHSELEDQIGFFSNTLIIRTAVDGDMSIISILSSITEKLLSAYKYADYPFDLIVEKSKILREPGRNPLIDVFISYDAFIDEAVSITNDTGEINIEPFDIDLDISGFDLAFNFTENTDCINLDIQYNDLLFKEETIHILYLKLVKLIEQLLNNELTINDINLSILENKDVQLGKDFNMKEAF